MAYAIAVQPGMANLNEVDESEESMVDLLVDAADLENKIETASNQCENAEDIAAALEQYLDQAIESRSNEPALLASRAGILNHGLSAILRCGGYTGTLPQTLSAEHYHTDPLYTSMEFENSVRSFLRELWSRIQGYVKKIVIWFEELYIKYISLAGTLKRQARQMKKSAMMRTARMEGGKITMRNFRSLRIANSTPTAQQMSESFKVYESAIVALTSKTTVQKYVDSLKDFEQALDQSFNKRFDHSAFNLTKFDPVLGMFRDVSGLATQSIANNSVSFGVSSSVSLAHIPTKLVGNKYLYVAKHCQTTRESPKNANTLVFETEVIKSQLSSTFARIAPIDKHESANIAESKETSPFSPGEVVAVCGAIESMAESILKYEMSWLHHKKQSDQFVKKMEKYIGKTTSLPENGDDELERRNFMANMASAGKDAVKNYTQSIKSVIGEGLKAGRQSLDFCGASLAHSK